MIHLWYNGTIYAGDGKFVESFAVEDGRFLAVGSLDQVNHTCQKQILASDAPTCTQPSLIKHDLHGRFVCAGFNDSHMHLLSLGKSLVEVNLASHTASKADMIAHLKESLARRPELADSGSWLCGRGWNQEYFQEDPSLPSRYDLDQISPDIPIYLARACGHVAVVNSKAIQLMGLTADTPQSPDASFDVDDQGQPTGILRENALQWAIRLIPAPTKDQLKNMMKTATALVNSYGITSIQSDDFDMWPEVSFETILACYRELMEEGALSVRVNEQCLLPTIQKLTAFLNRGYRTGSSLGMTPDHFRIGPLKLLLDGSLGANTAYLQDHYVDAPNEKGMPLYSQDQLDPLVLLAHQNGMQIAMHAIGDGAVQMGLDAYAKAQAASPRQDARHGIVHCQLTTEAQLNQFREHGIHAYIQSIFLDADAPIVGKRVSPQLAATSYQAATYLDKGISLSNGSDAPVELPDVMAGIQCAVTRRSLHTPMTSPYLPGQALSVAQAIDSFTMGGAYASFEEHHKGQIAPGMLADFVILEQDPFQVDPADLSKIAVYATVLGGEVVYSA